MSQLRCKINNVVIHNIKISDVYLMSQLRCIIIKKINIKFNIYLKCLPSYIANLLDKSLKELESLVYCDF